MPKIPPKEAANCIERKHLPELLAKLGTIMRDSMTANLLVELNRELPLICSHSQYITALVIDVCNTYDFLDRL